jgi:hypothetical protein
MKRAQSAMGATLLILAACTAKSGNIQTAAEVRVASFDEMYGEWRAAPDPNGELTFDPIYAKSWYRFGEGHSEYHQDDGPIVLGGAYKVVAWGPEGGSLSVHLEKYDADLDWHLAVRRDQSGQVVGFVLSEDEDRTPVQYYAP